MSWDGYIDSTIAQSKGNADKACIIGLNGGAPYTSAQHAQNLNLTGVEGAEIARLMSADDYDSFATHGILVGGLKYKFLRGDKEDGLVLGKLKDNGAITMQKTTTTVVIGHTEEGKQQGGTNAGVEFIVNYLKSLNM